MRGTVGGRKVEGRTRKELLGMWEPLMRISSTLLGPNLAEEWSSLPTAAAAASGELQGFAKECSSSLGTRALAAGVLLQQLTSVASVSVKEGSEAIKDIPEFVKLVLRNISENAGGRVLTAKAKEFAESLVGTLSEDTVRELVEQAGENESSVTTLTREGGQSYSEIAVERLSEFFSNAVRLVTDAGSESVKTSVLDDVDAVTPASWEWPISFETVKYGLAASWVIVIALSAIGGQQRAARLAAESGASDIAADVPRPVARWRKEVASQSLQLRLEKLRLDHELAIENARRNFRADSLTVVNRYLDNADMSEMGKHAVISSYCARLRQAPPSQEFVAFCHRLRQEYQEVVDQELERAHAVNNRQLEEHLNDETLSSDEKLAILHDYCG